MKDFITLKHIIHEFKATNYGEVGLALLAGVIMGFVFAKLRLPLPAPQVIAGIVGIIGIWFGYLLGK